MLLLLPFAGLGASMHSLSAFSRFAQPPEDCELEPQQSVRVLVPCPDTDAGFFSDGLGASVLNIADMGPRHGFASALSGWRIRSRETDCRRMG